MLIRSISCVLCLVTLFLTSCSQQTDSSVIIPQDAALVASIDFKSLTLKGELNNPDQYGFMKLMKGALQEENAETQEMVKSLTEDPSNSGINFQDKVYLSIINDKVMVSFTTKDEETLRDKIEKMMDSKDITIQEGKNSHYIIKDHVLLAWNENYCTIIAALEDSKNSDKLVDFANSVYQLTPSNSITTLKEYKAYSANQKDINTFVSVDRIFEMTILKEVIQEAIQNSNQPLLENIKGLYMGAYVDFTVGGIHLTSVSYSDNPEYLNMTHDMIYKFENEELLHYIPANNILLLAYNINMEKIADIAMSDKTINEEEIDAQISQIVDLKFRDLFTLFKGSIVFAFNEVNAISNSALATFSADLAHPENLDKLLSKAVEMGGLVKEGDLYSMAISNSLNLYIQHSDEVLLVTTDKNTIETFGKDGITENITTTDSKSLIENNYGYFYMNMNTDTYPSDTKATVQILSSMDQKVSTYLNIWNSCFKDIESYNSSTSTSEMWIHTVDPNTNSLKTILSTVDNNLMQFIQ